MTRRLEIALFAATWLVFPFAGRSYQQKAEDLSPVLRDALSALQRGDFQAGEQGLRAEVAAHPDNAWALSFLGAVLDNRKQFSDAEAMHLRAVARAPRSTEVLNNYAAHLWIAGNEQESVKIYRRIVGLDPTHYNANLQLARAALKEKNGPEALHCLDRLPAARQEMPEVLLPRLEALYAASDPAKGDALSARLLDMSRKYPKLAFAAGVVLSNAGQFGQAEAFFEAALQADPTDFEVLYDLGAAAARAGHYDRAREAFEAALRRQPVNVDVLYALACADHALRQWETAVRLLSQAVKLDPRRADVQRMLAVATTDLGALEDATAAWNRYLQLQPDDDAARRERGYTAAQKGQAEEGMADLEWYAARHPSDPVGLYELAQAERGSDLSKALKHLNQALSLDPGYVPALAARGSLYYQQSQLEPAVKDLEAAAALRPDDPAGLDRLGQAYQALDRTSDAVRVLRRAAELAPADSKTLLHFARALADAGNTEESKAVMDRFRQAGPEKRSGVRAGFVEYLALSDEQRHADFRARLAKAVQDHKADAALRVEYLKLLLSDSDWKQAANVTRAIAEMKPGAALLADAGHALLSTRQYALAGELLLQAEAAGPSAAIQLDLAVATFRQGDPAKGLDLLAHIPDSARGGDYYIGRAEMLDASGKSPDAVRDLQRSLEIDPRRPDLYRRAAALMLAKDRVADALQLLDQGARALPGNREIALMQAAAAELAGRADEAERALARIQSRWPEWPRVWETHAIILASHGQPDEARKARETAVALGSRGLPPDPQSYLRNLILTGSE